MHAELVEKKSNLDFLMAERDQVFISRISHLEVIVSVF
jgi:hypothetical protein